MHKFSTCILVAFGLVFMGFGALAQQVDIQSVDLGENTPEAWIIESHDVPIVTVKLAFQGAGYASDSKATSGRAQLATSLLEEGAGAMNALAFQQALDDHAIRLSFSVSNDELTVSMETLSENVDKAFELMGLALSQPRLDDDAVARVKAQMHSALRQSEEEPRYVAGRLLKEELLGDHPYANVPLGTHESIDALSTEDLKGFLHKHLNRADMLMVVVGDVDAAKLKNLTTTHLAGLNTQKAAVAEVPELKLMTAGQTRLERRNIPQTVVYIAGAGVERNDPNFYAAYVLNHLLGGGTLTSKLGNEIREKRGLAYYAYSSLSWEQHGAWLSGGFGTRNDQAADALQTFMQTLHEVQKGNITQQELDEAKGYLNGAFPLVLADNSGLAGMLMAMRLFDLGRDYIEKRESYIDAVTLEDVQAVAKDLLSPSKMVVVAVGDPSKNLADYR